MRPSARLDDAGFRALLRAASTRRYWTAPRDRALIYTLGKTGLRISEALTLRPSSLWLDGETPFLRVVTLKRRRRQTDEVLLAPSTVRELRRYRDHVLPALLLRVGRVEDDPYLFPALSYTVTVAAHPISRFQAAELLRLYRRLAGLPPGITPHSLRHYYASRVLRVTGDLEFTRSQLRHADIRNTQKYLHTSAERVRGYMQRLDGDDGGAP